MRVEAPQTRETSHSKEVSQRQEVSYSNEALNNKDARYTRDCHTMTFEEAQECASEILSACARELAVFGTGTIKGLAQTAEKRWSDDKAKLIGETLFIGAAGVGIGILSKNHRCLANGLTALGSLAFVAQTAHDFPVKEFSKASSIAWSTSDGRDLSNATNLVARGWDSPLFDAALAVGVGGLTATAGPSLVRRATFRVTDQIRPVSLRGDTAISTAELGGLQGGLAQTGNMRIGTIPSGNFQIGNMQVGAAGFRSQAFKAFMRGEDPVSIPLKVSLGKERLGLASESPITLEAIRQPSPERLGLKHYMRTAAETKAMRTPTHLIDETFAINP